MHNSKSFKHNGFSLIELVLVIMMLGILAASAAPKFIDLSADAKKANMQALAGAMRSAADLVFYKAQIPGYLSEDGKKVILDSGTIEVKGDGYPEAYADDRERLDIITLIDFNEDWEICYSTNCESTGNSSTVKIGYKPTHENDKAEGCFVRYSEPNATLNPNNPKYVVTVESNGC